jgi:PAS domain S-box-containing protein
MSTEAVHGRRMPHEWPAPAQYALSLGVVALSLLGRWMFGDVLEGHIPFLLTLGALLPLVLLVCPGPFLAAAVFGWVGTLYLFVDPPMRFELATAQQRLLVSLYTSVLLLGAAAAWLSRRAGEARERQVRELQSAEGARRESEGRLRLVTDAVPVQISYVDAQGRYQLNNRQYEEWFGHSREAIRGRHMREVLGDTAFERLRPHVEAVLTGRFVEFETEVPHKDGGPRFIQASYVPDVAQDGTVAGFYVLVRDITGRRRAESRERELTEQALAATAKFRSVFNQSGIFAGIADLDGIVREANDLCLTACGYRAEDVIGLPFWKTPWWRGSEAVQAAIREATRRAAAGEVYRARLPYWVADGSERVADMAMHPIRDDAGRVIFLHPTGIDITERERVESQLRRNHETFFNLVQNSPFGVYVVDARFRLLQVSQGAARVFQHVRPLLGRDFAEVIRIIWEEPFATEAINRFRHTLATGEPFVAMDTTERRHDVPEIESYDWRIERITLPDGGYGVVCYFYDLSDIKRAHDELRYRGRQFQTLVDQAPLGVLLVDGDLRVAQVNPAGRPVFSGIPDLVGRRLDEVMHILWPPTRADELVGIFRRALETGESCHLPELREVRADRGTTEYYDWRVDRITLPDGRFGVVCYFREISEAVRARQRVVDSEKRLRLAQSAARLGLHDYHVESDALEWDERTREIWGVAPDETVTYGTWAESLHAGDRPSAVAAVRRALDPEGGGDYVDQYRITNRTDGTIRWIEATGRVERADGRPVRLVGTAQDITERKRAEEIIRFHARLLEEVGQAVIVTDPQGVIIYWNRAAEELYGWSRAEAIGRPVTETTVTAEGEAQAAEIMAGIGSSGSWSGEFEVQCKDGSRRAALVTNTPMLDEEGHLTAVIGISVDITELKGVQRALKETDRRKDEFLATLAHELRNPLAAIRMALGVMGLTKNDPARVAGMIAILDRQSAQLVRLIDDLLDVSRITQGKVELRKEPTDLAQVLEHAVEGVATECQRKGVRVSLEPPREPLVIDADGLRFTQVVSNLLNNACKFTDTGGEIAISAQREGGDAVVRVRDTGVGIPPEELGRVFEMFAQVDGPHGRGGGLGIGLSLARSLVALHGGSIEARSDGPGRGSEFIVRTPVLGDPPVHAAETRAASDAGGHHSTPGRVLAVDDNRDALEAVAMMLRLAGYTVETAGDGPEAVEKARATRPDVVLLDIGLPGMDGYAVARRIRTEPWGRQALLVAMTGWGQEKDKQQARDAGFDAHLTKPVDGEELVRVLGDGRGRRGDPGIVLPVS